MSNTRRLSKAGKDVVFGYKSKANITQTAWHQAAFCAMPTLRRFLQHKSIRTDIFISICEAIGLHDWQKVAEPIQFQAPQKAFAIFGKVSDLDVYDLVTHLEKYANDCVSTESVTGTLILSGYFSKKDQDIVELILGQIKSRLTEGKVSIHEEKVSLIAD